MAAVREPKAGVPIIRVFRARARAGKERELADKLANTSPTVVKGKPAYLGYFAGGPAYTDGRDFIFVSMWESFAGMKGVFGDSWADSHLPDGYRELIEEHSVDHYELTDRGGR